MDSYKKFYIYVLLTIAETIALIWFSTLPAIEFIRTGFRPGDIEHFIAYSAYGLLLAKTFGYYTGKTGKQMILFSIIIGSFVGGVSETLQFFVPYRTADVIDLVIDLIGSSAGSALVFKFKAIF